jgi:hypothetical protein
VRFPWSGATQAPGQMLSAQDVSHANSFRQQLPLYVLSGSIGCSRSVVAHSPQAQRSHRRRTRRGFSPWRPRRPGSWLQPPTVPARARDGLRYSTRIGGGRGRGRLLFSEVVLSGAGVVGSVRLAGCGAWLSRAGPAWMRRATPPGPVARRNGQPALFLAPACPARHRHVH